MALTFIGLFLTLIGLPLLFFGSTTTLLVFILACGPMGGSAAMILPALGGSSIPPASFAMAIAVLRICMAQTRLATATAQALRDNWALLAFSLYAAAMAFIGPRLFRGALDVPPLRIVPSPYIYNALPLAPSSQNITTSVYLFGTLACAVIAYIACRAPDGWRVLVKAVVVIAWVNVALGVFSVLAYGTPFELFFTILRNGSYAQLEHNYGNFIRITGLFPETSTFAGYSFIWFAFLFECWYRDVMPRRTGPAAFALAMALIFSTSSTAYLSLSAYAVLFALRLFLPGAARSGKLATILLSFLAGAMLVCVLLVVEPSFIGKFGDMILHMTVEKSDSRSGLQRAFWARKALEAFWVSHGLGVGAGSFRSSSLIAAILGSTGVFGAATFLAYVAQVLKPLRVSTYISGLHPRISTGAAASCAILASLIPAAVSSSSCDPGLGFGLLAGTALVLRRPSEALRRGPVIPRDALAPPRRGPVASSSVAR